ncbi:MAG TPA: SurA N-terminal domain-containing protein [Pyrinomonadaceae bacterium]|nr:SurA N-terminal domain-containing protein [Pyrinomonadaceae bacterium]
MHKAASLIVSVLILALVVIGLTGCSSEGADAKDNTVAATVNGKKIMLTEIEHLISKQMQGQQAQLSPLQMAQARLQVLESLIQREVLVQRAEKENLKPTEDEITQYITAKKQEAGLTEEEFQKQIKAQNETEQSLRDEARKLLAIQKLQAKYTGSVSISDREVEDYFQKNKESFTLGRGVELAAIIVDPQDNGATDDAKGEAEAKLKIDNIYQQLKNADFAEVARARSEDRSNVQGGDLGFATEEQLKRNAFPETLITKFFGMQVGDYTEPVELSGRWYVFKLKRKQTETENRTLESPNVRQEITEALRSQRQQLLNLVLLEVAMVEAEIVNNLASGMLANPSNLGLRPASPGTAASPAASAAGQQSTPAQSGSPTGAASPAANQNSGTK